MVVRELVYLHSVDYDEDRGFSEHFEDFEQQYNTFYDFSVDSTAIPLSIFSKGIGCFQAIVKYLHDHQNLKFSEIAKLTDRDQRTIWTLYNQAKDKPLHVKDGKTLSLDKLVRGKSVLANIIQELLNSGMKKSLIAKSLGRNYQTIYTTIRKFGGGL